MSHFKSLFSNCRRRKKKELPVRAPFQFDGWRESMVPKKKQHKNKPLKKKEKKSSVEYNYKTFPS